MAPPVLHPAAQRLYEQFEHLDVDRPEIGYYVEAEGYPWAAVCRALARPTEPLYDLLMATANPWEMHYDLDRAPAWLLPRLAQSRGVVLTGVTDPDAQRALIRDAPARRRGRTETIKASVRPYLTGTQTVVVTERIGGDPYEMAVATFADETPDPAVVEAVILAAVPAGRKGHVTITLITGGSYADLYATHATYADVFADFATYMDLIEDPAHT